MKKRTRSRLQLPKEVRGSMVLTPALSMETNTHVRDLERLVRNLGHDLFEDLYLTTTVVQAGIRFSWGPVSELDLESMTEVKEEEY